MNARIFSKIVLLGALALMPVLAQNGPRVKSKGEAEAVNAIFSAPNAAARIDAVENLLTKYADTEFKAVALQIAAGAAQERNDTDKMTIYAERTLEADPKAYPAMLMLGQSIALHTREFDLDREEKLARAEKFAHDAMPLIAAAPKVNPNVTDDQWAAVKKDFTAQAHEILAASAVARKKYDVAIAEYKTAIEGAATQDPTTLARLTAVYNLAGKPDDALALADKILAMPNLHPAVRSVVANEKIRANRMKAKAAAPAPAPAPPPAPPKQ